MIVLAVQALAPPSPLAVAALAVMKAQGWLLAIVPVAAIAAVAGCAYVCRLMASDTAPTRLSGTAIAVAVPIVLLILLAVAQMPTEPLGKGGAREFYMGISGGLMLAVLAISLAVVVTRRWRPEVLADTSWAPLLLTVGAAGGLARVLDETGMAELMAEYFLSPRLGVLAPFLAAAIVKTLQGNSLSAVLTATGMVEPLLPAMGLDSAHGRTLAAAAAGAGAIAICHLNDPVFWLGAHLAGLTPRRALLTISLGSLIVGLTAAVLLKLLEAYA